MLDGAVYCCTACALQCADEYDAIVRCAAVDELATPSTTRDGRRSAARQIRRRQACARPARCARRATPRRATSPCSSRLAAERQRVRDVCRHRHGDRLRRRARRRAAARRAASARPPSFDDWRSLGLPDRGDGLDGVWGGAVRTVCDIYAPYLPPARRRPSTARRGSSSRAPLDAASWLRRVKDQCLSRVF